MREHKLKFTPGSFFHAKWLVTYRFFRVVKRGRSLNLLGTEQLYIALFSGGSCMMKAAEKSYYDSFILGTPGYPIDNKNFYGGVHHKFGTFTTVDANLDYKGILKRDMDEYRNENGLPPVKWKGNE